MWARLLATPVPSRPARVDVRAAGCVHRGVSEDSADGVDVLKNLPVHGAIMQDWLVAATMGANRVWRWDSAHRLPGYPGHLRAVVRTVRLGNLQ